MSEVLHSAGKPGASRCSDEATGTSEAARVALPAALLEQVAEALTCSSDMVLALQNLCAQPAQDEVMAGALYAIGACVEKLDRAIGFLPLELSQALKAATTDAGAAQ